MGSKVKTQLRKLKTHNAIQKRKAKRNDPFAFSNNHSPVHQDFDDDDYGDNDFEFEEYQDE